MNNESPNTSLQQIWQCQPVEGIKMSAAEIRSRSGKFQKKIMWRNVREYVAGLIAAVLLVSSFVKSHDVLTRVAFAMLIAGLGYLAYQLHRRASARSLPASMGTESCLQFHRSELERQRDFVSHIWRWYLGPLIPGLVVLSLASVLGDPSPHGLWRVALMDAVVAFLLIFTWRLNVRAACCLQRCIDDLYAAESAVQ
jgi:hypothetical protein